MENKPTPKAQKTHNDLEFWGTLLDGNVSVLVEVCTCDEVPHIERVLHDETRLEFLVTDEIREELASQTLRAWERVKDAAHDCSDHCPC